MPLFKVVLIIDTVIVLAPFAIYIMLRFSNLDGYRTRFRKTNPFIFWRDKANDGYKSEPDPGSGRWKHSLK